MEFIKKGKTNLHSRDEEVLEETDKVCFLNIIIVVVVTHTNNPTVDVKSTCSITMEKQKFIF